MLRKLLSLREKYGNIFRDVFVRLASVEYVYYVSLQIFMTFIRSVKGKLFSFISYCILYLNHSPITFSQICPLTNHSLPNSLLPGRSLRSSHSPIALSPRSLSPRSIACSHPPGPYYYAAQLAP